MSLRQTQNYFLLSNGPHKNCSTSNRLVAKITIGISRGDNCLANIFIGYYLESKLNRANKQGRNRYMV